MSAKERINKILVEKSLSDKEEDTTIRPLKLDEFIGQKVLIEPLKILIDASKIKRESVDHILLVGPPGLGKTTLANIIANEMRVNIKSTSGPVLDRVALVKILLNLNKGDVLFIDEIHRLNHILEEILFPVMEDFYLDHITGDKFNRKSEKFRIEKFTLIGATTRVGLLSNPFRDRFGFIARFNLYEVDELIKVIYRSSSILKFPITQNGAREIANRSRGTPRIANRLLRRVIDYALVNNFQEINEIVADSALELLGIDKVGLDEMDRRILKVIINDFNGGPVGIKNISISIGEDIRTIEEVYEPYLIYKNLIKRTLQGRETTPKGMEYLNIKKVDLFPYNKGDKKEAELSKNKKEGLTSLILIDAIESQQRRYKKYADAIAPIIPQLRDSLTKSKDSKIRIQAIDLAKNMGKNFEKKDEKNFLLGVKYSLFHNNLYVEHTARSKDDNTLLIIRERQLEDKLPRYLSDKMILGGEK